MSAKRSKWTSARKCTLSAVLPANSNYVLSGGPIPLCYSSFTLRLITHKHVHPLSQRVLDSTECITVEVAASTGWSSSQDERGSREATSKSWLCRKWWLSEAPGSSHHSGMYSMIIVVQCLSDDHGFYGIVSLVYIERLGCVQGASMSMQVNPSCVVLVKYAV